MRQITLLATVTAIGALSGLYLVQERNATAQPKDQASVQDSRVAITLAEAESAFIRREMRGLLESVRDILEASQAGDHAQVAAAARRSGMNGPEATHIPKSVAPKLLPEFKKLWLETHRAFDQIAMDAEKMGAADLTLKQLTQLMGNCVACHATWRLADEAKR
jgi:hypothetical protein